MKVAIANCCDTGPLESLHLMLSAVGYEVRPLSLRLSNYLRTIGCRSVNTTEWARRYEGVEPPTPLRVAEIADLETCDLFVDVKPQFNGEILWKRHPRLHGRTLYYRINGGEPEIGETLPCPVLTPNLWYRTPKYAVDRWTYTCWPPFMRFDDYYPKGGRKSGNYAAPICLVHNLAGWGYGAWAEGTRALGLRIHGRRSPDGLIDHVTIPRLLTAALAMVHLKSSDAPGYALYEGLAAACPMVVSERLVARNLMHELYEDGVTCFYFDRLSAPELSSSLTTPADVTGAVTEIADHLEKLRDPARNLEIGLAGRHRLAKLMWRPDRDGPGLKEWMEDVFPC